MRKREGVSPAWRAAGLDIGADSESHVMINPIGFNHVLAIMSMHLEGSLSYSVLPSK